MVEVDRVDAELVHLPVALVDQALTLATQGFQIILRDGALEHEEALLLKAPRLFREVHAATIAERSRVLLQLSSHGAFP
jgi:hypothetical protein